MTIRVAINGFGRIGRNVLRALYENNYRDQVEIVAINDLGDAAINAHLFKYDTAHGIFAGEVSHDEQHINVKYGKYNDSLSVTAIRNPAELPWKEKQVDLVLECTGIFRSSDKCQAHVDAGAKKVLISAPGKNVDATIVYGVNHQTLKASDLFVSNASCTTNCLAPLAKVLADTVGIRSGLMTTIHAYTNDQVLTDVYHSDPYRARSATQSMIPTKTGAAEAVGLVLPELDGKFAGMAVRVPTINVSVVDLVFMPERATSTEEVNAIVKKASEGSKVLAYNDLQLVSSDFRHNAFSSIFDANQTKTCGDQVKVMSWYDNEWGFSNRMLDTGIVMMSL